MISRITGALRSYSPATSRRTEAADRFVAAGESAGVYSARPEWCAPRQAPQSLWRTAVLTAVMAVGATSGAAALVPTQALAADLQAPKSKEQIKAEGLKLLVSSKAAQGEKVPLDQALSAMPPAAARLVQTLPPEAQQAYADLDPSARSWLLERVQGTTSVALGLITVNNREAFVSGSAVGQDVWAVARRGLAKQVGRGLIPAEMQGRLHEIIDLLARMTPEQRANLVGALEADCGHC